MQTDDYGTDWFKVELDSHADTCCVGTDVLIVNETRRSVKVTPFLKSLGSVTKVPIVTAAIAYDDQKSGQVFILILHQALHFKDMDHCLLCPMQLRLNDVVLNERPKFLTTSPTDTDHAIIAEDLLIPLELCGVTSYFPGRKPTQYEYENCSRIELTYPDPEWQPHDVHYSEEESRFIHDDGTLRPGQRAISIMDSHNEERFLCALLSSVTLTDDAVNVSAVNVSVITTQAALSAEKLSLIWGIGLEAAKRTLAATTQKAVSTIALRSVERRNSVTQC
jgi:hypothetical protein